MTKPEAERTAQAAAEETLQHADAASNQENEETTADQQGAETAAEPEAGTIPEKFRGKSPQEIAEAYRNLEKHAGRIASEKSHKEQEAEALKQRLAVLEQQVAQQTSQPQQRQAVEADPFANIEEELENDPKGTIRKLAEFVKEQPRRLNNELTRSQREQQAAEYYRTQMQENAEFRQLEPEMQQLARQYAGLVRPEHVNSRETMELLFSLAKGKNMSSFQKAAAEKAIEANNLVRDEKRRAVSESSAGGSSGNSVRFEDLSVEEMRRMLPVVEK